ncbi:acyl-CoA thioesterase [Actinospongicola halichondriae]|uniref:acyl-CoA thioesterase n=1 Tax=Actinospongicola halichondriae TaxID=3236844 RepID=UPI003D4E64D5
MTSRFATDTAVESVTIADDGSTYRATIDRSWWIMRGPNGGYLAAIIARALRAEIAGTGQRLRSMTLHYLRAPAEGPCEVVVTVERRGRTLTSLSVRLVQDGVVMVLGLAATAVDREGPSFADLPMPAVAPPEADAPRVEPPVGISIPMRDHYEMQSRLGPDRWSGEIADEAVTGGWIRLAEGDPVDDVVVAALTDAWTPAIFNRCADRLGVPTIDLTIHFRDEPPEQADWSFVRFTSRHAAGGYVEEDGEVWSSDGRLLAQSRQLAVELPIPE